jgi:hypothetical protein
VALLLINNDGTASERVTLPVASERYTLGSPDPLSRTVQLNGTALALGSNDDLPRLTGTRIAAGEVTLAPATITFLAVPGAGNSSCR